MALSASQDLVLRETFDRLTKPQTEVLANVAFGGKGGGCNSRTLESLERKGLIGGIEDESPGPLGVFRFRRWDMPMPVHIAFCAWCSEISEDDGVAAA
jgi:hypothetical protein